MQAIGYSLYTFIMNHDINERGVELLGGFSYRAFSGLSPFSLFKHLAFPEIRNEI